MSPSVLPVADDAQQFVLGPQSVAWRRAGDARLLLTAGYALMLQVAHPTVGAGVAQYSDFRNDPWGRLLRTLDYVNLSVYGGDAAAAVGRRVRDMHKGIKGQAPDGTRYHALEPEAYAWVHATLALAVVAGHDRFGKPMAPDERERFWAEWRGLARLLGVRERDLPSTWIELLAWAREMEETRLERTESVGHVLDALARPSAPPLIADPLWRALRIPPARGMRLATVGLLTPRLRRRLRLSWSARDEFELRVAGRAARALTPVLPHSLRVMGPAWLRWRADEIAAGPFAPGEQAAA